MTPFAAALKKRKKGYADGGEVTDPSGGNLFPGLTGMVSQPKPAPDPVASGGGVKSRINPGVESAPNTGDPFGVGVRTNQDVQGQVVQPVIDAVGHAVQNTPGLQTVSDFAGGIEHVPDAVNAIGSKIGSVAAGGVGSSNFNATGPTLPNVDFAGQIGKQIGGGVPNSATMTSRGADQTGLMNDLTGSGGLLSQLQAEAAGNGPSTSLAQALMKQATDQNIAKGAGMIASTRGINPGVAAKLAADQTAALNQGAAQQGAQLGLEQQIAARNAIGNTVSAAGNIAGTARGQDITGEIGSAGAANTKLGHLISGLTGQNTNEINASILPQDINAKVAISNNAIKNQMLGGVLNSAGGIMSGIGSLGGGAATPGLAELGTMAAGGGAAGASGVAVPAAIPAEEAVPLIAAAGLTGSGAQSGPNFNINQTQQPQGYSLYAGGGRVAGRAAVKGNSPKNDTVDAKLSPGEIVVPRSDANDPAKAERFVDAIIGKKNRSKGRGKGYSGVLQAKRELEEIKGRMATLEKKIGGAA